MSCGVTTTSHTADLTSVVEAGVRSTVQCGGEALTESKEVRRRLSSIDAISDDDDAELLGCCG